MAGHFGVDEVEAVAQLRELADSEAARLWALPAELTGLNGIT